MKLNTFLFFIHLIATAVIFIMFLMAIQQLFFSPEPDSQTLLYLYEAGWIFGLYILFFSMFTSIPIKSINVAIFCFIGLAIPYIQLLLLIVLFIETTTQYFQKLSKIY